MPHYIMENCIICSTCWDICPQDAVVEFEDYYRITDACDDCGTCRTACPNGAIAISVERGLAIDARHHVDAQAPAALTTDLTTTSS
jgi:MinD superfamily P-loop ATPase